MDTALTAMQGSVVDALSGIMALERSMKDMPQVDCPLEHWFPAGMYARKIFMPAGTVITSKVHKSEHLAVVMAGKLAVVSEDGTSKVIEAPAIFVTYPGTKRALYIHEDTVWLTVHRCEGRTVPEAEAELVSDADTVEDYLRITGKAPELLEVES